MAAIPEAELNQLLDATMSTLEEIFKGYGILFVLFGQGDGAALCNCEEDVLVEVAKGIIANRERVVRKNG